MAAKVLDILHDNDPCLKIVAAEVDDIGNSEIQQLILDMIATMRAAPGIGLAAPQVNVSLRIIVFYLPPNRDDVNGVGVELTVLINPTIIPLDDVKVTDFEGCLSVPGVRGKVSRYKKIRYIGKSQNGETIDRVAEGWHARLVQHEFDHLNGILYPELMAEEDKLISTEEWRRIYNIQ